MRAAVFLGLICIALELREVPLADEHAELFAWLFLIFFVMDFADWLKSIIR